MGEARFGNWEIGVIGWKTEEGYGPYYSFAGAQPETLRGVRQASDPSRTTSTLDLRFSPAPSHFVLIDCFRPARLMSPQSKRSKPSATEPVQAASLVVSRFRKQLDTTLGIPEWQNCARRCANELKLPAQRQGISFVQALLSLPIESKRDLANRLIEQSRRRLTRKSARSLLAAWGHTAAISLDATISSLQWQDIKRRLSLRMATQRRAYKSSQNLLFETYRNVAEQAAKEVCFDLGKLDDCRQEAACGLIQAIDRIEAGKPFASYAFQWARRRVRNYLMKNSLPVSAPINLISRATQTKTAPPGDASSLNRRLALALKAIQEPTVDFSDAIGDDEGVESAPCPIEVASQRELVDHLEAALQELTAKQREVLAFRFGVLNQEAIETLQGIARAIGISRQQVSRREQRALAKLALAIEPLRAELG